MSPRTLTALLAAPTIALLLLVIGLLDTLQQRRGSQSWADQHGPAFHEGPGQSSLESRLQEELRQVQQLRRSLAEQAANGSVGADTQQTELQSAGGGGNGGGGAGCMPRFTGSAAAVGGAALSDERRPEDWSYTPLEEIQRNTTLFVSFSNGHYADFLVNFSKHLKRLRAAHIVVPFDARTEAICRHNGITLMPFDTKFEAENMRNNGTKFRLLATQKPRIVERLFETYGFETVILTDTDTVWLRHPAEYIAQHPLADVMISTDCASHQAEVDLAKNLPRCGHIAGSQYGNAYNTGILVLRNRPVTMQLMRAWHQRLANPDGDEATKDKEYLDRHYRIGDQVMLNEIIVRGGHFPIKPLDADPALARGFHGKVAIHFLPALLFASGYVHFLQRLPERHNVVPYVVHATFQRDENPGKKSRFREWGWWLQDPPEYYSQGNFMSYDNGVRGFIDRTAAGYKRGYMARFHQHQLAASYQLAALQHALAIATALNRTLILPQMWCWCDQDADAQVLETCTSRATDMALPFKCPIDHIVVVSKVERAGAQLRYPNFLQLPQVPDAVRYSQAPVRLHPSGEQLPALNYAARFGAHVRAGMTQRQMLEQLEPWRDTRVLHWPDFQPGAFGGFERKEDTVAFDKMYFQLTYYQGWCCSGGYWVDKFEYVNWPYVQPRDLGASPKLQGRWDAPVYERPEWCDGTLHPPNQKFTELPNHPCNYLGDPNYGPLAGGGASGGPVGLDIPGTTGPQS